MFLFKSVPTSLSVSPKRSGETAECNGGSVCRTRRRRERPDKDAVLNDEAVPLALSKIKEEFNLRNFKTIDFMTEFQRVQNRAYAASALNAKSTGLQAYVDGARADIYVTVKISKEDFAGGASNVTL